VRKEDLRERLRTTDPVAHEPSLSQTEVQTMRRTIVAAVSDTRHAGSWSARPAMLTMAVAVMLAIGVFIASIFEPAREESTQLQVNEQRQLQFETPGGTRVVWVLNSQFDLPKDGQP
jgi:hypothetical protein